MNKELLYGIGGLFFGVILTLFVTMGIGVNHMNGMTQMMGNYAASQGNTKNSDAMDAHFIEQMIPHHEDAITMAKLAKTQAKTPEVKQLANNIIASQGKEIDQMKRWYTKWFGRDLPTGSAVMSEHGMMGESTGMHMGMMGDASDVSRLEDAADFDRAFVENMIPHHQMAVMMASMLRNGTNRPEMKQLADDIITAQTEEIDQMRQWLSEWK